MNAKQLEVLHSLIDEFITVDGRVEYDRYFRLRDGITSLLLENMDGALLAEVRVVRDELNDWPTAYFVNAEWSEEEQEYHKALASLTLGSALAIETIVDPDHERV